MKILGISAFYHDSAAALVVDGEICSAVQEERFTRKKHDAGFPTNSIRYCLKEANLQMQDLDYVVFYDKPFLKFERLLDTYLAFAPRGFGSFKAVAPLWLKEKLFQKGQIQKQLASFAAGQKLKAKLLFTEHHQAHAASAFFASPFQEAAVLTMDGVGEWATTSAGHGVGNQLTLDKEIHFPHSIGLLYSAFTHYTGFKVNSGEYKVMGLAPYGTPKYRDLIFKHLVELRDDGSFKLNMSYFDYCTGLKMVNEKFCALFGAPCRTSEEPLTQFHMDLAASVQVVTEEIVLRLTRSLAKETGSENLCLAGGVALNCVANGKILRAGHFKNIWIQPAAGDAGGALGAALAAYYSQSKEPREIHSRDQMKGSYLGPSFDQADINERLDKCGARYTVLSDADVIDATSKALVEGRAVGWFQGRMEFGPRSLGARSILGDPRSPTMQKILNLKVKYRESFRPFAPAVLREDLSKWFDIDVDSPYMLLVAGVAKGQRKEMTDEQTALFGIEKLNVVRSTIPAVTHVDYSARIQTVDSQSHPRFHSLLSSFKAKTGCPVLVNTSFNIRGEPIVCSPEDAYRCFMGTGIETLVIGNSVLHKEEQATAQLENYSSQFALD